MKYITTNHIAELAALITSLVLFHSLQKGKLKTLPFYLLFIVLVEATGTFLRRVLKVPNAGFYNVSIIIEYGYLFYLVSLHSKELRNVFIVCIAVLLSISGYYFLKEPFNQFHSNALVMAQLMMIIICCLYIYRLLKSAAISEVPLLKYYFFYIVCGLLIFNLVDVCYFLLYPYIKSNNLDLYDQIFSSINKTILPLLYLSYIISMIVFNRNKNNSALDV